MKKLKQKKEFVFKGNMIYDMIVYFFLFIKIVLKYYLLIRDIV